MMHSGCKTFAAVAVSLLFVAGCGARREATETVPPQPAVPAPMSGTASTIGEHPIITQTGSVPPAGEAHRQFEEIVIRDGSITMRHRLPRMNTAFRVTNAGPHEHALVMESASGHQAFAPPIPAGQKAIVQIDLADPKYVLRCPLPGHHERATFETYAPR